MKNMYEDYNELLKKQEGLKKQVAIGEEVLSFLEPYVMGDSLKDLEEEEEKEVPEDFKAAPALLPEKIAASKLLHTMKVQHSGDLTPANQMIESIKLGIIDNLTPEMIEPWVLQVAVFDLLKENPGGFQIRNIVHLLTEKGYNFKYKELYSNVYSYLHNNPLYEFIRTGKMNTVFKLKDPSVSFPFEKILLTRMGSRK